MATRRFRFESLVSINAGAIGTPGKRTFYLLAGDGKRQLRAWLEKQLLQALSLGIQRILQELPGEDAKEEPQSGEYSQANPEVTSQEAEFRALEVALGYDQERHKFGIFLYDTDDTSRSPTFAGWGTKAQMEALSKEIDVVCAAGRPVCPLCHLPIDLEGHTCPRSNGHGQIVWA